MSNQHAHFVTTTDGVEVGGAVHGQGPPLVFLPGGVGDSDLDWRALLPYLTDRFTCYLPSWRGRGLSGDHPDLSYVRLVDDAVAYVDSIGQPTRLLGWSGGAGLALSVAARSDAVDALAPIEPNTPRFMSEEDRGALSNAVTHMGELAAEGRLTEAVRAFAGFVFDDEETAIAGEAGYLDATARYVPDLLNFFRQLRDYHGPTHEDPAVLGAISAPVLVLVGSDTKPYCTAYAKHVADHVPNARIHEIPGVGHAAPLEKIRILRLARRFLDLGAEIKELSRQLDRLVETTAPRMVARRGTAL